MEKPSDRLVNLLGALSQAISDRVRLAIAGTFAAGGETAAALIAIGHEPGMSIDQISRSLRLSHAGAVRAVERLEIMTLVRKSKSRVDRRKVSVDLTDAGRDERNKLLRLRHRVISDMLVGVKGNDLGAVERMAATILIELPTDEQSARSLCRFCDEKACVDCPVGAYRCTSSRPEKV